MNARTFWQIVTAVVVIALTVYFSLTFGID